MDVSCWCNGVVYVCFSFFIINSIKIHDYVDLCLAKFKR